MPRIDADPAGISTGGSALRGFVEEIRPGTALLVLLLLAFVLRWGGALLLPSVARPDELFQNLEPAYGLWTGSRVITWEWRAGIRSWLFPGFLSGLMYLSGWLGVDFRALIAAVLSLFSISVVAGAFWVGWQHSRWLGALFCASLCVVWPDLIYYGPRTLTEAQAAYPLFAAAVLALALPAPDRGAWRLLGPWQRAAVVPGRGAAGRCLAIGLLLGWTFCLRFHLAPVLLLVALWAGRGDLRGRWLPLMLGGLIPVALFGAVDAWALGVPFQSIVRNFGVNIVEQRSHRYGVHPLHWYVTHMIRHWGAAFPVLALCFGLGARFAPLLASIAVAVVLSHMAIGHKEWSFIHAALPPALVVVGLGAVDLARRVAARLRTPPGSLALGAAGVAALVGLGGFTALGAAYWVEWRAALPPLQALGTLRRQPELCGLAIYGTQADWGTTGYATLRRQVPIFIARTPAELAEVAPGANYLVTTAVEIPYVPGYRLQQCWTGTTCLMRRDDAAACAPVPGRFEINQSLARTGE